MKHIFASLVILLALSSCDDSESAEKLLLRIKENKASCTGYEGQTECYLVQMGDNLDSQNWTYFYEEIDGFDYEPGFIYDLLVRVEEIKTSMIDSPTVKYSLIRELSKERI